MSVSLPLPVGTVYGLFVQAITGYDPSGTPIGIPVTGVVATFTPNVSPPLVRNVTGAPVSVVVSPIKAATNSNGQLVLVEDSTTPLDSLPLGVPLIASVGDNINPSGWTWTLDLRAPNLPDLSLDFVIGEGQELDLARIVSVPSNVGSALLQWQQALIGTQANADAASASAAYAADSASAAARAATNAASAAVTATTARDAASASASQAATSASKAADAATQATSASTGVTAARDAAQASAAAADASRKQAIESAGSAATSESNAAASTTAAAASATAAGLAATAADAAKTAAATAASAVTANTTIASNSAISTAADAKAAFDYAATAASQAQTATTQAALAVTNAKDATTAADTATKKAAAASLSADSAASSATNASASQTVAGTSADVASTAANNADASRAAAQAILDSFNGAKGVPNGFAILDGTGKLPANLLPSSVMEYKGTWDASTNTPRLTDGASDKGDFYTVAVAGTQNLGSGNIEFQIHDQLVHNGTKFEKIDNTDAVTSVAGKTGAVVVTKGDVGLDKVDNTADIDKPISTQTQTVLNTTVSGATIVGRNLIMQQVGGGTVDTGTVVPTLSVGTVTTSAPGAPATLTLTGSAPNQSINITIPQGPQGDQGIQGLPGDLMFAAQGSTTGVIDLTTAGLPSTNRFVMSGNITGITLPTTTTASKSGTITLVLVQDVTGNRTVTWPASVLWSEGVKAQPSTAPASISVFNLEWTGNEWLGFKAGQNFA